MADDSVNATTGGTFDPRSDGRVEAESDSDVNVTDIDPNRNGEGLEDGTSLDEAPSGRRGTLTVRLNRGSAAPVDILDDSVSTVEEESLLPVSMAGSASAPVISSIFEETRAEGTLRGNDETVCVEDDVR